MSLRRYSELKQSSGTHFPSAVVAEIRARDQGCVGPRVGMPGQCDGPLDPDHVRASGGLGMKSRSTADNGVMLCRFVHHRLKTLEGRRWRPRLLGYLGDGMTLGVQRGRDSREFDLFNAYRQPAEEPRRTLPCACGGFVSAYPTENSMRVAIQTHQETERHRAWWAAADW